jgi:hypothetical protein
MEISPAPTATRSTGHSSPEQKASYANRTIDMAQLAQQQAAVQQLAQRDREVRAHEQAHAAVGGAHAGHPNYQFTSGPNGVRYASGGHVSIDISPVKGDPQATVEKMQQVQRAALAPANPSAQDRSVASKATAQATEARAELQRSKGDERVDDPNQPQSKTAQAPHPPQPQTTKASEFGSTSGSLIDLIV